MTFSEAMDMLSNGKNVRRSSWDTEINVKMAGRVALMDGEPWLIASEDSMADDWEEVI
jgi:hypothetical protein